MSDDSQFNPLANSKRKKKRNQNQQNNCVSEIKLSSLKKGRKKNDGNWSEKEQNKFLQHMKKHSPTYRDKSLRRSHKIFQRMSKFMRSRTPQQCRSHHQKYELKLKNYDAIISALRFKLEEKQPESPDNFHNSPIQIQDYMHQEMNFQGMNLQLVDKSAENEIFFKQIFENKKQKKIEKIEKQEIVDTKIQKQIGNQKKNPLWQLSMISTNKITNISILIKPAFFTELDQMEEW